MIKLAAVDMDGTLLGRDGRISGANAHAIRCMQNAGTELLICTGRGYVDAVRPLEEAGLKAGIVCMNGASVYDQNGNLIDKKELALSQVEFILTCCRGENVLFDFMTDRGSLTIAGEEEFRECFNRNILLPVSEYSYEDIRRRFTLIPPGELFGRGLEFFKISVIHEKQDVLEGIRQRLKKDGNLAVASSFATNLELTHIEAQKGRALADYAAGKNIRQDEIMAIGDSENDYSMLSMNLKYTVAMGNAMDIIKKTAKCQTRTNDQDGVAYAIENLILGKEARA